MMTQWNGREGREAQDGGDIYMIMTDLQGDPTSPS